MYWTLELAQYLSDAPWPANKDELIDYAIRTGALLKLLKTCKRLKMRMVKFMIQFKIYGQIFPHRKITFGMKRNIKIKFLISNN